MNQDNDPRKEYDESTLDDVKQLGLWAALGSLSYVFWIVGGMEMIERLAYYGVRAVATIYATRAQSEGGLGVTMATFGWLLFFWNMVQSLVPIFTGGLSDRYGYKETIFVSTVVKCFGYAGQNFRYVTESGQWLLWDGHPSPPTRNRTHDYPRRNLYPPFRLRTNPRRRFRPCQE